MSEKPILYSNIFSPGCRAVLLAGAELDVEFDIKEVDLMNFAHKKADYIEVSGFLYFQRVQISFNHQPIQSLNRVNTSLAKSATYCSISR